MATLNVWPSPACAESQTAITAPAATPAAPADSALQLDKIVVSTKTEVLLTSIDRKTYNVGKDIRSASGSTSDLLQNIPSVSVDIDGNISLRGSENVQILINGRTSPLMGTNRAAVLEQMPADSIERIEVITNPSAKYKPDGTSGIINIVLKKKHAPGFSGSINANAGNDERLNSTLSLSYNPGRFTVFGTYSVRQDDRQRYTNDLRLRADPTTAQPSRTLQHTEDDSHPLSHIIRTGMDYEISDHDKAGVVASYNHRTFTRRAITTTQTTLSGTTLSGDSARRRIDYEYEKELEVSSTFQHTFPQSGHELNLEFKVSRNAEQEDNHYVSLFNFPAAASTLDNTLIKQTSSGSEFVAEYVRPLGNEAKFEAGYTRESNRNDMDFFGEFYDPASARWVRDTVKTKRFIYEETVHALYGTYAQSVGKLGFLGGVRLEQAYLDSHLVNTAVTIPNDYFRLYPTLHLSYELAAEHELQLNYSHRVRRPEGDDLNPFPEYRDPLNLRVGNPHLLPEDIHSIEFGHQFKRGDTSLVTTGYYRYLYHGLTEVTRYLDDGVTLMTTKSNLSKSSSLGVEMAANTSLARWASLDASTNTFFNTIDASSLGYSADKSTVSWIAKLGLTLQPVKGTLIQISGNYTSAKLTPQGHKGATYLANFGIRHEIFQRKAALTLTVSDVFNSLKDRTTIDTPILHEEVVRRRSPRIIYVGLLYKFGQPPKKAKDEKLHFDEGI